MAATDVPSASATSLSTTKEAKLRLGALTALVIGSMVGSGVLQNMAAGAGPLATMIGWAITAIGMLALIFAYQSLDALPDVDQDVDRGDHYHRQMSFLRLIETSNPNAQNSFQEHYSV